MPNKLMADHFHKTFDTYHDFWMRGHGVSMLAVAAALGQLPTLLG